jgi:heat shock protein HtpX
MVLVAVLTPLAVLAAVAGMVLVANWKILLALTGVTAFGVVMAIAARRRADDARILLPSDAPDVHTTVERLCVLADIAKPDLVLERTSQANSWVIDLPARPARLHVTQGLPDVLTPEELEVVLAHELSHIVHRDATVMTTVGLPGAVLLEGSRELSLGWTPLIIAALFARVAGMLSQVGVNALSRYRESHADAAAARMTGRPAALASALTKLSGAAAAIPNDDLRAVAAHNAFNLLPVEIARDPDEDWADRIAHRLNRRLTPRRLTATHPSVERRVAALERLERQMHGARPSSRILAD